MTAERPVNLPSRRPGWGCLPGWLLLLLLIIFPGLYRCSMLRPRGVSILVPEPKGGSLHPISLSPDGTKLFYGFVFVRDLMTGETQRLPERCNDFVWLDNQTLCCMRTSLRSSSRTLIDVRDYSTTSVPGVDAQQQSVEAWLHRSWQQVYELGGFPQPRVYLLRAAYRSESVYLFNVAEDLQATRRVAVMYMAPHGDLDVLNERVSSPDRQYYYINRGLRVLRLYQSADDSLVREVGLGGTGSYVAGWMYDSSGVIYLTNRGVMSLWGHFPIYKLNVPREGWRWPWE